MTRKADQKIYALQNGLLSGVSGLVLGAAGAMAQTVTNNRTSGFVLNSGTALNVTATGSIAVSGQANLPAVAAPGAHAGDIVNDGAITGNVIEPGMTDTYLIDMSGDLTDDWTGDLTNSGSLAVTARPGPRMASPAMARSGTEMSAMSTAPTAARSSMTPVRRCP